DATHGRLGGEKLRCRQIEHWRKGDGRRRGDKNSAIDHHVLHLRNYSIDVLALTVWPPSFLDRREEFRCDRSITRRTGDIVRPFERPPRRSISNVDKRQVKGLVAVVATSGVELRAVIREGKQVASEENLEPGAGCFHLCFGVDELTLRRQHVS